MIQYTFAPIRYAITISLYYFSLCNSVVLRVSLCKFFLLHGGTQRNTENHREKIYKYILYSLLNYTYYSRIIFFMKLLFIALLIGFSFVANAQYSTPGNGTTWNLESLAEHSEGVIVEIDGIYYQYDDVTISPTDKFEQLIPFELRIAENITLSTEDAEFIINTKTQSKITAISKSETYRGISFGENAKVSLNNCVFEYGGGIRVFRAEFSMNNCIVRNMDSKLASGGAIAASGGDGIWSRIYVNNSHFVDNVAPALSSSINIGTTFIVEDCYFENNNTTNNNRPQINIGATLENDVTIFRNNTIIGNRDNTMTGGIGIMYMGVARENQYLIDGNTIKDNRYGINFTGDYMNGTIVNNILEDNNTETNPMVGGSGINITNSADNIYLYASNNIISGHHWGVTLYSYSATLGATCNFGNITVAEDHPDYNPGKNIFSNNGFDGELYDFYNNSPTDVMAQNNQWNVEVQDEESIEDVVTHKPDDESLGFVTFMPAFDSSCVGIDSHFAGMIKVYPVPASTQVYVEGDNITKVELYNIAGRKLSETNGFAGLIDVSGYDAGIYFLKIYDLRGKSITKQIVVK